MEQAVTFCNGTGQSLVGVWHCELQPAREATLVMLHGWSGYRSGPHQMLTRAARAFAAQGYDVLRFDFAGRGDSEGTAQSATLATMTDDARAALRWCRQNARADIILVGLCSGCEVAVAAADESNIRALILWSAPIFAAGDSASRSSRRRVNNLKKYGHKLLQRQTYSKLISGRFDIRGIRKALKGEGGESRNADSGAAGALPAGWRDGALQRFRSYKGPRMMVYGTADPTAHEAASWYRGQGAGATEHYVQGANHSYYGLAWEIEVVEASLAWLRDLNLEAL